VNPSISFLNIIQSDGKRVYFSDENGHGNIVGISSNTLGEHLSLEYSYNGQITSAMKYSTGAFRRLLQSVNYYYDAFGRRVAKKVKLGSKEFIENFEHLGLEDRIFFARN
jgi:hypothetical protein